MKPQFSQRDAETAVRAIARRIYRRHAITESTSLQDAVAIAAARGDHVAAALSQDRRALAMAAGLAGGNHRKRADRETVDALQLLAVRDTFAEAKFPPPSATSAAPAWDCAEMRVPKGRRGPSSSRRLAQAERKAEARGIISSALFVMGIDDGPVRVGLSRHPQEQLRLSNRHCLLTSHIGLERYATSNAKAQRVVHAVMDYAKTRGLRHPTKQDVLTVPMNTAIAIVHRMSEQLAIPLLSKEEKARTIAEFERAEWEREDRAFDLEG